VKWKQKDGSEVTYFDVLLLVLLVLLAATIVLVLWLWLCLWQEGII